MDRIFSFLFLAFFSLGVYAGAESTLLVSQWVDGLFANTFTIEFLRDNGSLALIVLGALSLFFARTS